MFVRDAKARCPHLMIVPYNFDAYEEVADQFYGTLHKHCSKVQALSCDEAFLDMTECLHDNPEEVTQRIRSEIFHATKCTASAGIAENMLLARLATRSAKPNGQCFIPSEKGHLSDTCGIRPNTSSKYMLVLLYRTAAAQSRLSASSCVLSVAAVCRSLVASAAIRGFAAAFAAVRRSVAASAVVRRSVAVAAVTRQSPIEAVASALRGLWLSACQSPARREVCGCQPVSRRLELPPQDLVAMSSSASIEASGSRGSFLVANNPAIAGQVLAVARVVLRDDDEKKPFWRYAEILKRTRKGPGGM
ncbi:DNA repair protein REV1 [Zea mays]|nr:DNA repair protein REV1 [Zea mays]AQK66540.1 DNA repair protein REV1 [Zea mays]